MTTVTPKVLEENPPVKGGGICERPGHGTESERTIIEHCRTA